MDTTIHFGSEHCNIGILLYAMRNAEIIYKDELNEATYQHQHLEMCLGFEIPTFEQQLEKFREEKGFRSIEELLDGRDEDDVEIGEFNEIGYTDLEDYELLVKTAYMLLFAYFFFGKKTEFDKQSEISLEQYTVNVADHVTEEVLKASQVLHSVFTDSNYVRDIPLMAGISTMIENIKILSDYDAMNHAMQMNGFDGVRWLSQFNSEMTENLLCLNDDYAEASQSYPY